MKKNLFLSLMLIAVAVFGLFLIVYFTAFETLTVVQDQSWLQVIPKGYYLRLRIDLIKDRTRLVRVTVNQEDLTEKRFLISQFQKTDTGGKVLVSPAVSAALAFHDIDIKEELKLSSVIGIGTEKIKGYFDDILVSDSTFGWIKAAKSAVWDNETAALVFDDGSINEARIIYQALDNSVKKYNAADYGSLFGSEIRNMLNMINADVVFCPYIADMNVLFEVPVTQKWVTDYRFSGCVPKENLRGVVFPDIYQSLKQNSGVMVYDYRNIKRSIF